MADAEAGSPTRRRGDAVEAAALAYLEDAGLRAVARNANARGGELDLVMMDAGARGGEVLVFVEVRYRAGNGFGGGAASVDARKRRKLVHAARVFLSRHRALAQHACRFDVIDATGDPARPRIEWIRDAFRADD
jgi:putative endonuclease